MQATVRCTFNNRNTVGNAIGMSLALYGEEGCITYVCLKPLMLITFVDVLYEKSAISFNVHVI